MIVTSSKSTADLPPLGSPEKDRPTTREETAEDRRSQPIWLRFLRRVLVYFMIYVLSLGPMYWRWWEGKYLNGSRMIAAFYEPLFLLTRWIPPLGWFVNGYVHIWVLDLKWTF